MNIARQTLAMSFCLLSFVYLLKRQVLKSFLLFLPAWGFHHTAIIYLIVYPIFHLANKEAVRVIRIVEIIGIIATVSIMFNLEDLLSFVTSQKILPDKFLRYASSSVIKESSFHFTNFAYCIFLFWILQCVHRKTKDNLKLSLFIECLLMVCIALSPITLISADSRRCTYYFLFLSIVFLPLLFYDRKITDPFSKVSFIVVIGLSLFWFHEVIQKGSGEIFPYTSKILGIT
jgi:hypothetical protein